jgi:hypothetical protein
VTDEATLVRYALSCAREKYPDKPERTLGAQAVLILAREWDAYEHGHGRAPDPEKSALYERAARLAMSAVRDLQAEAGEVTARDRMLDAIATALTSGAKTAAELAALPAVSRWTRALEPERVVRKHLALEIRDSARPRWRREAGGARVRYALAAGSESA